MATRNPTPGDVIDPDSEGMTPRTGVQISSPVTHAHGADEAEETELSVIDRMRALMSQSPTERIKLKCYRARNGSLEWCDDFTPEEFEDGDLKMIRDRHGPGKYEFRLMTSKGIARRIQVHIAPAADVVQTAQPVAQNSELSQVLAMLAQGQQRLMEALTEKPDPMASMQQMLAMAASMREAFGMNQNAAPPQNPMAMLKEVLEAAREVKATAHELGADDKPQADPSDPMSMLPGIVELVKTAMQGNAQQQPQHMQPLPPLMIPDSMANPIQTHHPAPVIEQTVQPEPETVENLIVKGLLEDLCQLAVDGKPPADGAAFIFEKLPDELIDMMSHRYWFEIVSMRFALVKPHEKWLREAKAEADKLFAEDAARPDDEP